MLEENCLSKTHSHVCWQVRLHLRVCGQRGSRPPILTFEIITISLIPGAGRNNTDETASTLAHSLLAIAAISKLAHPPKMRLRHCFSGADPALTDEGHAPTNTNSSQAINKYIFNGLCPRTYSYFPHNNNSFFLLKTIAGSIWHT